MMQSVQSKMKMNIHAGHVASIAQQKSTGGLCWQQSIAHTQEHTHLCAVFSLQLPFLRACFHSFNRIDSQNARCGF